MELINELKRKLRVTWDDDDAYLRALIERAQSYINSKCEVKFNYSEPGQHRTLMLERCFYDFNNALNEFEDDYQGELIALMVDTATAAKGRKPKCTR